MQPLRALHAFGFAALDSISASALRVLYCLLMQTGADASTLGANAVPMQPLRALHAFVSLRSIASLLLRYACSTVCQCRLVPTLSRSARSRLVQPLRCLHAFASLRSEASLLLHYVRFTVC